MGGKGKGKWFVAVKKAFGSESKKNRLDRTEKKQGIGSCTRSNSCVSEPIEETSADCNMAIPPPPSSIPPPPPPAEEEDKVAEGENEQSKHTVVAEAVKATCFTTSARFSASRPREDVAVIKIQTAFRGYKARRALRGLKGLVRLNSLMEGNAIKRQTANTLHSMQTLAKVQSQIHSRRIKMLEENRAFQRQLQLKREKELGKIRMGEEWDDSLQSKHQKEANAMNKQEASMRRERALAYAFSRQWRNSSRSVEPLFVDPTNLHWGWSWLERWTAARPWESRSNTDRDLNSDRASVKSASQSVRGEVITAYARRDSSSPIAQKSSRPPSRQSPSTPPSKPLSVIGRTKSASPRGVPLEDDTRSMHSFQSERPRRHSIGSMRDGESLASSPSVPSYMEPTKSVKSKSRSQSISNDKIGTPERVSVSSVKKRLSFPVGEKNAVPSPARARRHSVPPKVDISSLKEAAVPLHNTHAGGSR